jgi:hypothetical protein
LDDSSEEIKRFFPVILIPRKIITDYEEQREREQKQIENGWSQENYVPKHQKSI